MILQSCHLELTIRLICCLCCAAARRVLESAQFSSTGATIVVNLNAEAAASAFECSRIFNKDTVTLLGSKAWCTVSGRQLTVKPDALNGTVDVNSVLSLEATQTLLVDRLQATAAFSGTTAVTSCQDCTPPNAVLAGPQVSVRVVVLIFTAADHPPHPYCRRISFYCKVDSTSRLPKEAFELHISAPQLVPQPVKQSDSHRSV